MPHQCTNCSTTFPDGSTEMLSGCPHCGGNTFQYIPKGREPPEEPDSPPDRPDVEDSVSGRVGRAARTVKEYVAAREDVDSPTGASPTENGSSTEASSTENGSSTEASPEAEPEPTPGRTTDPLVDDGEVVADDADGAEDRAQASARNEVADLSEVTGDFSEFAAGSGPPRRTDSTEPGESAGGKPEHSGEQATPDTERGRVLEEPNSAADTDLETLREELNDQFESIKIVEPGQYELNLMELYDREEHIIALREDGKYVIEVPESWREDD